MEKKNQAKLDNAIDKISKDIESFKETNKRNQRYFNYAIMFEFACLAIILSIFLITA